MPIINKRDADLNEFPLFRAGESKHVSLGDLHGNALKLIYVMIEEGVLELKDDEGGLSAKEKYETLRDIYLTPVDRLTRDDINVFAAIINSATSHKEKAVTLIGDELADRGENDYFTLLILQKLKKDDVNIDILLSNHSAEFFKDYDRGSFTGRCDLMGGQGNSLLGMYQLISNGLIDEKDVRKLVLMDYKPMVKAISYTMSPEGDITLFSHAPIGLETIKALAVKLNTEYNDHTPKELIHSIDAINEKVQGLIESQKLAALIDEEAVPSNLVPVNCPLYRLTWNRALGDELVLIPTGGFNVNFVHGHIGPGEILQNRKPVPSHQNMDSLFGKAQGPLFKTGPDLDYPEDPDIEHLSRESNELSAKELTPAMLSQISDAWLLKKTQEDQQRAQQRAQADIQKQCEKIAGEFTDIVNSLRNKTNELVEKGTKGHPLYNPRYEKAAEAATKLMEKLDGANNTFFSKKEEITPEKCTAFKVDCTAAINEAQSTFKENRSIWATMGPALKGFVIAVTVFFTAGIFPLAMFIKDKIKVTDAAEKLGTFKQSIETIYPNIENQAKIKADLALIRSAEPKSDSINDPKP